MVLPVLIVRDVALVILIVGLAASDARLVEFSQNFFHKFPVLVGERRRRLTGFQISKKQVDPIDVALDQIRFASGSVNINL